jgi:hypothetical protein
MFDFGNFFKRTTGHPTPRTVPPPAAAPGIRSSALPVADCANIAACAAAAIGPRSVENVGDAALHVRAVENKAQAAAPDISMQRAAAGSLRPHRVVRGGGRRLTRRARNGPTPRPQRAGGDNR